MSQIRANVDNATDWFEIKMRLVLDPYFEREFFTNIIHCIDRHKSLRDLFEQAVVEVDETGEYNDDVDRSLLHLFYAYQTSNSLREGYQWLPLSQAFYSLALSRGEARRPLDKKESMAVVSRACQLDEFEKMIRREARKVNSYEQAWSSFLFLLEGRSTRSKALAIVVSQMSQESDDLSLSLLLKSIDLAFGFAWKRNPSLLKRSFERFWTRPSTAPLPSSIAKAASLLSSGGLQAPVSSSVEWKLDWSEDLWHRLYRESVESAWEKLGELAKEGCGLDQMMNLLDLFRGRLLYGMGQEQWPLVTRSLVRADAWRAACRWLPEKRELYLAASLADFCTVAQRIQYLAPTRPTGESIYGNFSENMTKNQLVLRLDDVVEKGDRETAYELMALLTREKSMSQSLSDRLLLMASKQDSWTYDRSTIPTARLLTQAYQWGIQMGLPDLACGDGVLGLLRFLSDQRIKSLLETKTLGQYKDGGMSRSVFDVSGGARIVDRFVFNQLRNAQRIFIWPNEGKG
jgi:hypothetical protein